MGVTFLCFQDCPNGVGIIPWALSWEVILESWKIAPIPAACPPLDHAPSTLGSMCTCLVPAGTGWLASLVPLGQNPSPVSSAELNCNYTLLLGGQEGRSGQLLEGMRVVLQGRVFYAVFKFCGGVLALSSEMGPLCRLREFRGNLGLKIWEEHQSRCAFPVYWDPILSNQVPDLSMADLSGLRV